VKAQADWAALARRYAEWLKVFSPDFRTINHLLPKYSDLPSNG
jgi:hypothetical protein